MQSVGVVMKEVVVLSLITFEAMNISLVDKEVVCVNVYFETSFTWSGIIL